MKSVEICFISGMVIINIICNYRVGVIVGKLMKVLTFFDCIPGGTESR